MIFQVVCLALFFFSFLVIQISTFKLFNFSFLKKGKDIKLSPKRFISIALISFLLIGGVTIFTLTKNQIDSLLYLYTFIFLFGIFLNCFLIFKIENLSKKFLISITIATLFVSLALLFPLNILKNILIAGSLLWVSPFLLKQIGIKKSYLFIFVLFFMLFDIYNVYFLTPDTPASYNYFTLNGYVEFGRYALGMGDFFLGYLVVSLLYIEKGWEKSLLLAFLISLPLLILNLLVFKHDFPYSVFITILTFVTYFIP